MTARASILVCVVLLSASACTKPDAEPTPAASSAPGTTSVVTAKPTSAPAITATAASTPAGPSSAGSPAGGPAPTGVLTIDQLNADKAKLKGMQVKVKGLYMGSTWKANKEIETVTMKPTQDPMAIILTCGAGDKAKELEDAQKGLKQFSPMTVQGTVNERNFSLWLDNCSPSK
jgi:hypothetical protein